MKKSLLLFPLIIIAQSFTAQAMQTSRVQQTNLHKESLNNLPRNARSKNMHHKKMVLEASTLNTPRSSLLSLKFIPIALMLIAPAAGWWRDDNYYNGYTMFGTAHRRPEPNWAEINAAAWNNAGR